MFFHTDNTLKLAKALSHPTRLKFLMVVAQRGEASPKQVHEEIGEELSNVSYHAKCLAHSGLIEIRRTEPRRGALEHFYGSAPDGAVLLASLAKGGHGVEAMSAIPRQREEADSSVPAPLSLRVDEQGAEIISEAIKQAEQQVLRALAESDKRLDLDGAGGVDVQVAISFSTSAGSSPSAP